MELQVLKKISDTRQLILSRPAIATSSYTDNAGETFIVTGPKVSGSSPPTPATSTQTLIDWYLNLGIPANNILWNVVGETGAGGTFAIDDMTFASVFDNITITNPSDTLYVQDIAVASIFDNITLELASGVFAISDIVVASSFDNITLGLQSGVFEIADMTVASVFDDVVLVLGGGTLAIADMTVASAFDNVVLESGAAEGLDTFSDSFTGTNGDPLNSSYWTTTSAVGTTTKEIQSNQAVLGIVGNAGTAELIIDSALLAFSVDKYYSAKIKMYYSINGTESGIDPNPSLEGGGYGVDQIIISGANKIQLVRWVDAYQDEEEPFAEHFIDHYRLYKNGTLLATSQDLGDGLSTAPFLVNKLKFVSATQVEWTCNGSVVGTYALGFTMSDFYVRYFIDTGQSNVYSYWILLDDAYYGT